MSRSLATWIIALRSADEAMSVLSSLLTHAVSILDADCDALVSVNNGLKIYIGSPVL